MEIQPPPNDAFLAIYWTLRDLRIALARRIPEFEGHDFMDLLGEELSDEQVGYSADEVEGLANTISRVLEDISVSRGWEVIEDSINFHLGFASLPDDRD